MRNKSGFALVQLVLAVVIVVAVAGIGFYVNKDYELRGVKVIF